VTAPPEVEPITITAVLCLPLWGRWQTEWFGGGGLQNLTPARPEGQAGKRKIKFYLK